VLRLTPCIPAAWPSFKVTLRFGGSWYDIELLNPHRVTGGLVTYEHDGEVIPGAGGVTLLDDGARHRLVATLAAAGA